MSWRNRWIGFLAAALVALAVALVPGGAVFAAVTDLGKASVDLNSADRQTYQNATFDEGFLIYLALDAAAKKNLIRSEKIGDTNYQADLDNNGTADIIYRYVPDYEIGSWVTISRPDTCSVIGPYTVSLTADAMEYAGQDKGKSYSEVAITFKAPELSIKSGPGSGYYFVGETAKFSVKATGWQLKYQWKVSKDGGSTWSDATEAGSRTADLTFPVTADKDEYLYQCVVTDGNNVSKTSDPGQLFVAKDAGRCSLDLSMGEVWLRYTDELEEYYNVITILYVAGVAGKIDFDMGLWGPARFDFDRDGTWDVELQPRTEGIHEGIVYQRTIECSIEGAVLIRIDPGLHYFGDPLLKTAYNSIEVRLSAVSVACEPTSYTYDGGVKTPKVTVTAKARGASRTLTEGKEYTLEWPDERKEPGTYKGTVRLNGGETLPVSFTITKPAGADSAKQTGEDGTPLGKGASAKAAENAIISSESEEGPAGSKFGLLQMKSTKQTKNSIKLTWSKVSGAKTYVLYANKCGKKNKYLKLASYTGKSATIKKVAGAKLKKGTYYKFLMVALDGKGNVISASKTVHVATKGGKVGNDKKVTTKAKKNKVTVKVNKTFKLKAKSVPASKSMKVKKHRGVAYESSDPTIATVSKKGEIKGVKKGKCTVYAYAQNGVCVKIKVTIK